jgi:DNA-binding NarL/FixJ family response regulator
MRVLWVENHAGFVRAAGRQFLARYELTVVPTVEAARAALIASAFHVVMVDYDLDDGKGTEVIALAKELVPRVGVVAASSHAEGNARLLAAGADAVCPKLQFANVHSALDIAFVKARYLPG